MKASRKALFLGLCIAASAVTVPTRRNLFGIP